MRAIIFLLGAPVALALLASGAAAGDGTIDILPSGTNDFGISFPGSYVLAGNVTMTVPNEECIVIFGDDVTLDLNGHTLTGLPGSFEDGIRIEGERARVFNGTIRRFGGEGISFDEATAATLEDLTVMECRTGIQLRIDQPNVIVRNCNLSNNSSDGLFVTGQRPKVLDCVLDSNGDNGIEMSASAVNPVISGNVCTDNTSYGIQNLSATGVIVNNISSGNTLGQYTGVSAVSSISASREWGDNLEP